LYICKVTEVFTYAKQRRILISPLNWGLGHATRLVPVVDYLIKQGHVCVLAGDSPSLDILAQTFPQLQCEKLDGFRIHLSSKSSGFFSIMMQAPAFIRSIVKEKRLTHELVRKHQLDLIISDNRYGVRSSNVESLILTHQIRPDVGSWFFIKPFTNLLSRYLLGKFDMILVPDFVDGVKLSGKLSKSFNGLKVKYIGILSRLQLANSAPEIKKGGILVILSGPEPQRSEFQNLIVSHYKGKNHHVVILAGQPDGEDAQVENIDIRHHCSPGELKSLVLNSEEIVCRSGYSTLMDLMFCGKKALLIPTPGQYEQEYLARRMKQHFGFEWVKQSELSDFLGDPV